MVAGQRNDRGDERPDMQNAVLEIRHRPVIANGKEGQGAPVKAMINFRPMREGIAGFEVGGRDGEEAIVEGSPVAAGNDKVRNPPDD